MSVVNLAARRRRSLPPVLAPPPPLAVPDGAGGWWVRASDWDAFQWSPERLRERLRRMVTRLPTPAGDLVI